MPHSNKHPITILKSLISTRGGNRGVYGNNDFILFLGHYGAFLMEEWENVENIGMIFTGYPNYIHTKGHPLSMFISVCPFVGV